MCFAPIAVNLSTNINPPALLSYLPAVNAATARVLYMKHLCWCNNHKNITARVMSPTQ